MVDKQLNHKVANGLSEKPVISRFTSHPLGGQQLVFWFSGRNAQGWFALRLCSSTEEHTVSSGTRTGSNPVRGSQNLPHWTCRQKDYTSKDLRQ